MTVRRLADEQPATFEFSPESQAWCERQISKYPPGREASAVIALLWRAQKENQSWLPKPAIELVARMLGLPYIRVLEIATFYSMFNLAPVGEFFVQMCGTTPCMLAGSNAIKSVLETRVGPQRQVTADGKFSWLEVECLGACCNAPMVQINEDYYEDLTPENFEKLLADLAAGRQVKTGSQSGRVTSEPVGGLTSLTSLYGVDGKGAPKAADEAVVANADVEAHAAAEEADIKAKLATLPHDASAEEKANAVGARPQGLSTARGDLADDLRRIKGIGPVNERRLNELGIFHFDQIAGWTRPQIRWVGTYLSFPGRIDREQWVAQASGLAAGGQSAKDHGDQMPAKA